MHVIDHFIMLLTGNYAINPTNWRLTMCICRTRSLNDNVIPVLKPLAEARQQFPVFNYELTHCVKIMMLRHLEFRSIGLNHRAHRLRRELKVSIIATHPSSRVAMRLAFAVRAFPVRAFPVRAFPVGAALKINLVEETTFNVLFCVVRIAFIWPLCVCIYF